MLIDAGRLINHTLIRGGVLSIPRHLTALLWLFQSKKYEKHVIVTNFSVIA